MKHDTHTNITDIFDKYNELNSIVYIITKFVWLSKFDINVSLL